jgi:hypothetical protein
MGMIPGINNIPSVGTSPLKRGGKMIEQVGNRPAGNQSLSVNKLKYILPSINREKVNNHY